MDLGSPALQPPSWQHPLGTDSLGRDVRSVLLYAGRSSLTIGFCAAAMAFLIGGTIGALAGYFRGAVAAVLLRVTDLFHTLPAIIIVLFSVSLMGSSFWLQVAAVALAIWPIEARHRLRPVHHPVGTGIRAGGARRGPLDLPHHLPRDPAQRLADGHRPGLARRQHGDPDRGRPGLSRAVRSDGPELGRDAEPRAGIPRAGVVDERVSGHGDLHRRAGLQSVRRRASPKCSIRAPRPWRRSSRVEEAGP